MIHIEIAEEKERCRHNFKLGWAEYAECILKKGHEGKHKVCPCRCVNIEWDENHPSARYDEDS